MIFKYYYSSFKLYQINFDKNSGTKLPNQTTKS